MISLFPWLVGLNNENCCILVVPITPHFFAVLPHEWWSVVVAVMVQVCLYIIISCKWHMLSLCPWVAGLDIQDCFLHMVSITPHFSEWACWTIKRHDECADRMVQLPIDQSWWTPHLWMCIVSGPEYWCLIHHDMVSLNMNICYFTSWMMQCSDCCDDVGMPVCPRFFSMAFALTISMVGFPQ